VYQCAKSQGLKAEAMDKLDKNIERWFYHSDEERIKYLSLVAPNGSRTHTRAFQYFLNDYLE
jgi:hypothetical protein